MTVDVAVRSGWRLGFESLEAEHAEAHELPVEGTVPRDLDGTLYRIGPARHDVYGERYRHWFDGDGMVHALTLGPDGARYRNRFVGTEKKRREDVAGRRLFGGFGTPPAGGPLARLRQVRPMSAANTNVVFHSGRLLALWEAGRPWRLDPQTLETLGEDDLGGALTPDRALSAHPKLDPATGELWNFGADYGPRPAVHLYRTDPSGLTASVARVPMPLPAMVHDFALTARAAVLVFAPLALDRVPLGLVAGARSFGDSLRFRPARGTTIAVVDRGSGEVSWHHTDPFVFFHTANAWDEGDDVVLELCTYPDAAVMRLFTEVMVGRSLPVDGRLERLHIGRSGVTRRPVLGAGGSAEECAGLEFPRVSDAVATAAHRHVFGVTRRPDADFLGTPVVVDTERGRATFGPTAAHHFAGELVPVPKGKGCERAAGAGARDDAVWLLTLVLDAAARRSELWVLDGEEPDAPPVARVLLPHVMPFGFHGNWVPAAASAPSSATEPSAAPSSGAPSSGAQQSGAQPA
jgi:all-trans-8'-apo-beta-carotenal 15,15'-oxygenase